jgi:Resolvase, N terminal domain
METTSQYSTRIECNGHDMIARIAIYARVSRDPGGLSANTSMQVAECLEEVKCYAREHRLQVKIAVILEENDVSASEYSKKSRPDFRGLIKLIKDNEVDVIFATEVERLVRQPAEGPVSASGASWRNGPATARGMVVVGALATSRARKSTTISAGVAR